MTSQFPPRQSVPFPEGLCVWRANLRRSSPRRPESVCGARRGKHWTQTWPDNERKTFIQLCLTNSWLKVLTVNNTTLTSDHKPGWASSWMCEFSSCPTAVCQEAGRVGRKDLIPAQWTLSGFCGDKYHLGVNTLTWHKVHIWEKPLRLTDSYLQAWTTTMILFLWELCLTVSWTSPSGKWLGPEPLQTHGGGRNPWKAALCCTVKVCTCSLFC